MSAEIGVQRDGLRADPDAEVDLLARWCDDLATTDDPRAVRLRAGNVRWIRHGLSSGDRRKTQPRCHKSGERTQMVDPRFISRPVSRLISRRFSGHVPFSLLFFITPRYWPCEMRQNYYRGS